MNPLEQFFQQVARGARSLGYRVLAINAAQLDLRYGSLMVSVRQNDITSRFYLQDTIYNRINYPGFKNHRTPAHADDAVHRLDRLKKQYRRIAHLHVQVLHHGDAIDGLIQRMKLAGLIDKSTGRGGIAENLHTQSPSTMVPLHQPARSIDPSNTAQAKLLTEDAVKNAYRQFMDKLKRTDRRKFEELQRQQSWDKQHDVGNMSPLNPPVVYPSVMPTTVLHAAAKKDEDDNKPTPTEKIKAAVGQVRSLREFKSELASLAYVGRHEYMAVIRMRPKQPSKSIALDATKIAAIAKDLQHSTGYQFIYKQFIVGKRAAITFRVRISDTQVVK